MKRTSYLLFTVPLLVVACSTTPVPVTPTLDTYNYGEVTRYGAHYADEGIESNVYMLDLYSPGLTLNEQGVIEGTGHNLCFSDVFTLPTDSRLQGGVTYVCNSTGRADTFLPGQDFDGNINGAYLLDIKDGQLSSITLFTNGEFIITQTGDTTDIDIQLVTTQKTAYHAVFHAPLHYQRPL